MIITVTLNPAIDKTLKVDKLKPGELNRVREVDIIAGGKGINVARVVHQLGEPVVAMGFLGGDTGQQIDRFLEKEGLARNFTWTEYPTRVNMKILENDDRETEVNEPGQVLPQDFQVLKNSLKVQLKEASLLVLSGSLPQGVPEDAYNQLMKLANQNNVSVILDTAGKSLKLGLREKPYLIKPNLHEVELLIDKRIDSTAGIYNAVDYFIGKGVRIIVISMGSQGAVFADRDELIWVKVPEVEVSQTTVGAGDSMVAGLAIKLLRKSSLEEMARFATALATTYVKTGRRDKIELAGIKEIESQLTLEYLK
ncbi:MAG: 1-phosphofructokinase [Halanaerobiales bacterium]|nr:1-phosphofructokinase [Halanaerobiales bacterium]